MSDRAVMPLSDYDSACDKVREKVPRKTIVKNKTFYPTTDNNVTEIITKGTLKLGKSYYVNYNNATMATTSNIYEVRNIEVQGVSTKGIEMLLSLPTGDEYKTKICIYQDEENIMLYASEIFTYEDYPTYITLEKITGKIVSGELSEKIDEVYEEGQKAEQDRFWDTYQNWGQRINYMRAFYQSAWRDSIFNPKYDIITGSGQHHAHEIFAWADITDTKRTIKIGKTNYNHSNIFYGCEDLKVIRNLDISEYSGTFVDWFLRCYSLENLNVKGYIKGKYFDVYSCPLTHESLMGIINALYPYVVPMISDFSVVNQLSYNFNVNNHGSRVDLVEGKTYRLKVKGTLGGTSNPYTIDFDDVVTAERFTTPWGVTSLGLTPQIPYEKDGLNGYLYFFQGDDGMYMEASAVKADGSMSYAAMDVTVSLSQLNESTITEHALTLGPKNIAKLNDAEKAIATQKGWSFS